MGSFFIWRLWEARAGVVTDFVLFVEEELLSPSNLQQERIMVGQSLNHQSRKIVLATYCRCTCKQDVGCIPFLYIEHAYCTTYIIQASNPSSSNYMHSHSSRGDILCVCVCVWGLKIFFKKGIWFDLECLWRGDAMVYITWKSSSIHWIHPLEILCRYANPRRYFNVTIQRFPSVSWQPLDFF